MIEAPRALIVEDQPAWLEILSEILTDLGLQVDVCTTFVEAQQLITSRSHRIAVVDLSLQMDDPNDQSGILILEFLKEHDPGCAAVLLSGFVTVGIAVSAIQKFGAYTCLQKETFQREEFCQVVNQALNRAPFSRKNLLSVANPVENRHESNEAVALGLDGREVLVVDDDAGWRSILSELVEDSGCAVQVCSSYGEALSEIRKKAYGLVILDLVLGERTIPGQRTGGITLLEQIDLSQSKVIILSGEASPGEINGLLAQYPVAAFIEKRTFQRETVLEKIQEILSKQPSGSELIENLTQREQELLGLLVKGYSNQQIADQMMITMNTVKRHTKAVFRKMGIHSRSAAAAMFHGNAIVNKGVKNGKT